MCVCACVHVRVVWCGVQVCARRREQGNPYGLIIIVEILKIAAQVDGYGGTVPCYIAITQTGPQE